MSAVRRHDRRVNRTTISSPYTRPSKSTKAHPSKKSGWSLSGLFSFLNPFGGNSEPEDSDMSGPSDGEIEQGPPPRRFSPPVQPLPPSPPPPQPQLSPHFQRPSARNGLIANPGQVPPPSSNPSFSFGAPSLASPSLAQNLEPVTRFLVEKAGQPLNEFEAAGIVDYIQKSVQGSTVSDKPEPFRFSVSPSRGGSPSRSQGISGIETPRKTLSRNPNGVYRWQGAGSSRPRNRYQSPGFAPRPQQHRMKLSPPRTPPMADTKRRRVGDEAESSTPQKPATPSTSTIRFPSSVPESPLHHVTGPSGNLLNGKTAVHSTLASAQPTTPLKANVAQPRLRTAGLATKPTTPAIPSPLRQTWKESDSPPQPSPPSRPTRAAGFMTELIKEVTPTKKPDVSNPYQTASPVKPPAPVRKPVIRRPKPTPKPAERPVAPEPEISAQAIIEATVPKGTKRSRPPPEVEKPVREEVAMAGQLFTATLNVNGPSHTVRSTSDIVEIVTIVEDVAEVEESPSKRRRTPTATPSPPPAQDIDATMSSIETVRPAEIIEPADDNVHVNGKPVSPPPVTLSPPSVTKSIFSGLKTSAPKEPSKLRYSFHADKVEVNGADAVRIPSFASLFAPAPILPLGIPKSTVAPKAQLSPKEEVLAMNVDELPKYTFSVESTSSAGPSLSTARNGVLALTITSLPVYEFTTAIAPICATNGFNWTAAGMKAPTSSAQTWTCSLCCLQNTADAKEKCAVCDAPRQAPTASSSPSQTPTPALTPPPKGFDWGAAGLAPPPKRESGTWVCSVCSLSNDASAADKCSICETPR